MTNHYQVAVIGGGIVGCACLYSLVKRGWSDAILLERLDLTHGSTWHAAGNVTHFGHYPSITRLYVDSLKSYLAAEAESDQQIGLHQTGSLRLADNDAEMAAYARLEPLYQDMGIPYRLVTCEEITALHPLLNQNGVVGAAYTPDDGHVDPSATTQALPRPPAREALSSNDTALPKRSAVGPMVGF